MCVDPMTAISVGSAALGAFGSLASGSANAKQAEIAAQVARVNSQMALQEGSGQVAQVEQRVGQAVGRTRAAFGAGNIAIGSGSSLADQVMSAQQGNTDKQLVMARALNSSAGQSFQAASASEKAGQDKMAGIFGAGTSLLSGLAGIKGLGGSLGNLGDMFKAAPGFMTGAYGF